MTLPCVKQDCQWSADGSLQILNRKRNEIGTSTPAVNEWCNYWCNGSKQPMSGNKGRREEIDILSSGRCGTNTANAVLRVVRRLPWWWDLLDGFTSHANLQWLQGSVFTCSTLEVQRTKSQYKISNKSLVQARSPKNNFARCHWTRFFTLPGKTGVILHLYETKSCRQEGLKLSVWNQLCIGSY